MIPENLTSEQIQYFLLIFVRIVTIVALLPVFGVESVPGAVKAGLSLALSFVIFPFVFVEPAPIPAFSLAQFALLVVRELFVGLSIGFATSLLFVAVQFAGRLIDNQMGFALVELVDPFTNLEATMSGQLMTLVFSIIFLLVNGHYFLLLALRKSFEVIPLLGATMPGGEFAFTLVTMVGNIFVLSIRLAAPVYAVLILTAVALGIIARTVPQLNVFFVGLPLKIGLGLTTIAIVLPGMVIVFREMITLMVRDIWKLLYLMA
jgi:flagellar biosynthetic protein FliR